MAGERGSAGVGVGAAVLIMLSMSMLFHYHVAEAATPTPTLNWIIPTQNDPQYYNNWLKGKKFHVNDKIAFNFEVSEHNAYNVTQADYDACTAGTTAIKIDPNVPFSLTKTKMGAHYFICTFTGHCTAGMKMQINLSA